MSYITSQDFTNLTWQTITNTARFTALLSSTKLVIDGLIGDLQDRDVTFFVPTRDLYFLNWILKTYTTIINITDVKQINGENYTWKHQISWRNKNIVLLEDYNLPNSDFGGYNILLRAGFTTSTMPDDIKLLQAKLIQLELSLDWGKKIKSHKLWPRTIVYADEQVNTWDFNLLSSIIDNYMIVC